jgi:hypothetical protein
LNVRLLTRYVGWLTLAALLALAPTAYATVGEDDLQQVVDGYTITLAFAASPVQTGGIEVVVRIRDAAGTGVTGAIVTGAVIAHAAEDAGHADTHSEARASDPNSDAHADDHAGEAHSHAPVAVRLEPGAEAGAYQGWLFFYEPGRSTVTIAFELLGEMRAVTFDVAVVRAHPRALVLGGFAAINVLVIITAAVLKRRRAPDRRGGSGSAHTPSALRSAASTATQEDHRI